MTDTNEHRRDLLPDFHALSAGLPCDDELLPGLGRVFWASAVLHRDVVTALGTLRDGPVDRPWDLSLAEAVRDLGAAATRQATDPDRDVLVDWCRTIGWAAARARDGVVYRIVHGTQLDPTDGPPDSRYGADDLDELAGRLVNAARTLPTPRRSGSVV